MRLKRAKMFWIVRINRYIVGCKYFWKALRRTKQVEN